MASRVRVAAGVAAGCVTVAVAGVALLVAVVTPAGGVATSGRDAVSSPSANESVNDPSFEVTETYEPEDPAETVADPDPVSARHTTIIIPSLGLEYPVVKGTDDAALARGVGVWDNDTGPGEKGNYVLAGHRITHGEPFADVPDLRRGDRVIIETASYRFVYVMDTKGDAYRVDDTELWPVDPLPRPVSGGPNRVLTLITCAETFHTDDRFVAFGHLEAVRLRPHV